MATKSIVPQLMVLQSDRQLLPNTGTSRARDGLNGSYTSRGPGGPWQCDVDVTLGDAALAVGQARLYQVGPSIAELRPAAAGLAAATPPVYVALDADGIADLPAAGAAVDGICVALESQGTKTWARVVQMTDGLLYVLNGAVALTAGVTVKTDAAGKPVVAAAGDQSAGVTVRACDANKIAAIRGTRGKIA